ncbi:MAG TPA: HIT domain-containing protein [Candidatus Paceibacterota bacterium]
MENCVFCKIVAGDIPSNKVYEDNQVIAFLDIHPKGPGHTLVIPKEHYRWFEEMPEDLYTHVFKVVRDLSIKMKQGGADHVQVGIVGKDVPHVHVHLIPRQPGQRAASDL